MFNVSESFKLAAKQPVQEHKVTGTIGSVSFSETNIVDGSFSITNQSTDTNDVVLGSCYVGQLTAEFIGINIAWGKWINKTITPTFQLKIDENTWESVPLGVFKIKEAKHTERGVQVTAYDNMIKFDKKFKKSHFMNLSGMTNIIDQLCTDAGVILGMSYADIEALPNGDRTGINIYGSKGKKAEFANDITTLRDLLFWVAQTLGCFATINRAGQLVFRPYTQTVVDRISEQNRIEGATFADYVTHYVGIYVENLDDNTEDYYGYDVTALTEERNETLSEIENDNELIAGYIEDLAEWDEKLANHECTQQEYDAAVAEITAAMHPLELEVKQLAKRLDWLNNAIEQAADDGSDMVLGANPLVMAKSLVTRDSQRREILGALDGITYTPFQASVVCGCIYDLGDVIQFSGGLYNSETDSFGCVMAYTYTHNGGTELEGFGVDPSVVVIRNKTQKSVDRASKNGVDSTHNQVGAADPNGSGGGGGGGDDAVPGKSGDFYIRTKGSINEEPLQMAYSHTVETTGHPCSIYDFSGNNASGYTFYITGIPDGADHGEHAYFDLQGLEDTGQYHLEFDAQYTQAYAWGQIGYQDYADINGTTIATFPSDRSEHHYSVDFTYHTGDVLSFRFYKVSDNNTYIFKVSNFEITTIDANANGISYYGDDGKWHNIDYVKEVTQTQTSGTEIAEVVNSDGSTTKIYQKDGGLVDDVKVDDVSVVTNKIANIYTMSGATSGAAGTKGLVPAPASGDNEKYLRGDGTWQTAGGGGESVLADSAINENDKLFDSIEQTRFNQTAITYTATKDCYAECTYNGSSTTGMYPFINNKQAGIYALTRTVSVILPLRKGDIISSRHTGDNESCYFKMIVYGRKPASNIYAPIIYSTEEREIGVWTDGKPLYQITITNNSGISSVEQWLEIADIGNTKNIIDVDGKIITPVGEVPFNYNGEGSNISYITNMSASVVKTLGKITARLSSGANWLRNNPIVMSIQYTKVTDIAGSGNYAALGVPAVHYDDTERVIGTYFGKPLYRKAWTGQSIFLGWQGGSAANYTTGTWQNNDVADMKLLVNLKLIGVNGLCDTPMGTKSASTTITLFSKIQDTYDTLILEYTKTTD